MQLWKDVCSVVAILLIVAAYRDQSVADAISAGVVASGVFGKGAFSWLRAKPVKRPRKKKLLELHLVKGDESA